MSDTPAAPEATPVQGFAQCHVGIVSHLKDLARLPALLDPARQARQIAGETLKFFRSVVFEHHAEEERELFPAVLASAHKGAERDKVQLIVERLTREHRRIEAAWSDLERPLKAVAKGAEADLDDAAVAALVHDYLGHAGYEEAEFLPLSQEILGRNDNRMAALGLSLHLRHAVPDLLMKSGFRG